MVNCPFCRADLGPLSSLPESCPACGRRIPGEADRTLSDDSAEWGAPEVGQTVESSGLPGESSASGGKLSVEEANSQTVQSEEFSWGGESPAAATPPPSSPAPGPGHSHECDVSLIDKTVQSDEFSWSADGGPPAADDPGKTVASDEFASPEVDRTVQSDEFRLSDASGNVAEFGNQKTVMSEDSDWDSAAGQTMLSDELPQDAIKTMKTAWSGAFEGATNPGMTIKGGSKGKDHTSTKLVIKQRQLSQPDEAPAAKKSAEYELIRVLGEGGMGVVYDARQTSVDRSVAVKMLKPRTSSDERQRQKFLAEAVVTGDLDHPNIVPIYDVGTSERGLLFYAMKKVKGTPWMKLLPRKSQAENLEILMKVADAVGFAHARGVIHRDLKPENVMLGDFGEVLVMDWGLALPAPGYSKSETISPAHSMGGTPAYMAPEMASGPLDKITFASDVYLLGAILYEILTGRPPHSGKNTMQCLFAAAKNDIRPTDKSGELMDIAMKAMATEVKSRYADVRAFQDAIRDYQSHTESIVLSTRAAEELEKAGTSDDYRDYARSTFAFEEALALWDGNVRARSGLATARFRYADSALRRGDYDLGLSLLDESTPEHAPLRSRLQSAQRDRDARQQRLRNLKNAAIGMAALFIVGMTGATIWINSERNRAVTAEGQARDERDKAVKAREQEEVAKTEAQAQEQIAIGARRKAEEEEQNARVAEAKAREEEKNARAAEAVARDEQRKAEIAKQQEEYEAYIARIGLAAAKIDENAFTSAADILKQCAEDTPQLLHWEWGRLMYLCGQSALRVETGARLEAAAYSPDGGRFVTGGSNGAAVVWDAKTGKELLRIPHGASQVNAVAWSPDGSWIATGSTDRQGFLRIVDARTGELLRTLEGHSDGVTGLSISRDGSRLLSASYDRTARVWEVASGRELLALQGHTWWVWSAAFSPDDTEIVTASQDGSAIVWSAADGSQKGQFLGHRGPVYSAAYAPDGRVATGGYDKRVLVWRPSELRPFDFRKLAADGRIALPPLRSLEGHAAGVRSVAFSQDGDLVLSCGHDNTVRIWDSRSGRGLQTFRGHGSWVRACAFAPDYRQVLSVSHDNSARLWSITDYEEVRVLQGRVLEGHDDAVLAASFSSDGAQIVTASRDRTARTWSFRTGQPIRRFEEGHQFLASNAVFAPGGNLVLTSAVDNTVRFWDVGSGSEIRRLERTGRAAALALSHDGRFLLTGADDRTAKLWDAATGELVQALQGHKHEVTAVAWSRDDALLATCDANGVCLLWDARTYALRHKLASHTGKVTAAAFHAEGRRLLTASTDKTVAQWDTETGRELPELLLRHPDAVLSLALLPNAPQALTACGDGKVRLWDLEQGRSSATLTESDPKQGFVSTVAVSPDGRRALTVNSAEAVVRLWDLQTGQEIETPAGGDRLGPYLDFRRKGGQLWTAAFSPDGETVLTVGGTDARLWDLPGGSERMSFSPHGIVASAEFSHDGRRIVTASWDNSARVWDAETGRDLLKLTGQHTGYVNSAAFSPDGALILTASDDRTAVLWNSQTGEMVRVLEGHAGRVHSAVFSPDGTRVLTASGDKTARLWDVATGQPVGEPLRGHTLGVLSAHFSSDGSRIVTGSEDRSARIYDVAGELPPLVLAGHTASVSSVTFLPDAPDAPADQRGRRVLTGSLDNSAKLWDGVTGKEILTLKGHSQEVTCVNTSPTGRYLLTGSRDGTALVWLTVDWKDQAQGAALRGSQTTRVIAAEQ